MLVLKRDLMQSIDIGENIRVTVVKIKPKSVTLVIDAPRDIEVWRRELKERIEKLPETMGGGRDV